MDALNETGVYKVDEELFNKVKELFIAGMQNEEEVIQNINTCYNETGYLLDTHTAVGYGVYKNYQKDSQDKTKTIILSTASPYKFPKSVYQAITQTELDEYESIDALNALTKVDIPTPLKEIKDREVLHTKVIDKKEIVDFIGESIKGL
jgi:threonine synthase